MKLPSTIIHGGLSLFEFCAGILQIFHILIPFEMSGAGHLTLIHAALISPPLAKEQGRASLNWSRPCVC